MGIPTAYVNWIRSWLEGRRGFIEIQGKRSKSFAIHCRGPQDSSITPALFITYHSDMENFLTGATSYFFADDVAAVVAGQIGKSFTNQCLDLEQRLNKMLVQLEYYSILSVQPINYSKTQAMFSARAINYLNPMPTLQCGNASISWVYSFKYLGYMLTTKLGWGNMIRRAKLRIRQQIGRINSIRIAGSSSVTLRRTLFSTFARPFFTWLLALHPLLTEHQRTDLNHLYYTCLKRILHSTHWDDFVFAAMYNERSLDNRCYNYWAEFLKKSERLPDGRLLVEQHLLNLHRVK